MYRPVPQPSSHGEAYFWILANNNAGPNQYKSFQMAQKLKDLFFHSTPHRACNYPPQKENESPTSSCALHPTVLRNIGAITGEPLLTFFSSLIQHVSLSTIYPVTVPYVLNSNSASACQKHW